MTQYKIINLNFIILDLFYILYYFYILIYIILYWYPALLGEPISYIINLRNGFKKLDIVKY